MIRNNSTFIKIVRNLGKILALIVALWLQTIGSIVLYMKGVPLIFVLGYAVLFVVFIACLLWPRLVGMVRVQSNQRRWTLKNLGIPTLIAWTALYMFAIFYIEDTPVLLGIAAAILLIYAWRGFSARGSKNKQQLARRSRSKKWATAGVLLAVGSLVSIPLVENYRKQLAADGEQARQAAIAQEKISVQESDQVRIYPIQTGTTTVSYGQFYGGLNGWEGFDGYLKTLTSKHTIKVPVVAYLIDHPKHGLSLFDAGVNWEQANDHDGYYNHNFMVSRLLTTPDEYQLGAPEDLRVQVERLGYKAEDIKTVFLSHVHDDHAGGLRNVPQAEVVLDKKDWNDDARYPYSFAFAEDKMVYPNFDSGPFMSFPKSKDFYGDGSVVIVPTPGHSPGHVSMVVRMDGYNAFLTGDTIYTLRHLAVDEIRQIMLGGESTKQQVAAAHNIQKMIRSAPETVLLFAHDHTDYHYEFTQPYLADGSLDKAEHQALHNYRDNILTKDWKLRPGNYPYFQPKVNKPATGVVDFR